MKDTPYTMRDDSRNRMNELVLGRFLEKHPDCDIVRQEYNHAKANVAWTRKQRKKRVIGRARCPNRSGSQTHFAIQDGIGPIYIGVSTVVQTCLADLNIPSCNPSINSI